MNKADIIAQIAADAGISKAQAEKAVNSFTTTVTKSLKKGEPVILVGFGRFSVVKYSARKGRHPVTGEPLKIKAKKVAKFKAGHLLTDAVAKAKTSK
ncbi:DNA-binding protein HU-beta [bacterium A37T11]|nr:DNA-binding protein HU-beta [bacterium A37T11]